MLAQLRWRPKLRKDQTLRRPHCKLPKKRTGMIKLPKKRTKMITPADQLWNEKATKIDKLKDPKAYGHHGFAPKKFSHLV